MGVFDFFFSHSKQKQGKPIRDKIKNRKHFEKENPIYNDILNPQVQHRTAIPSAGVA